eukprot:COSAG05_NODE_861_length_6899_cov_5.421618_2_plen_905_part_00
MNVQQEIWPKMLAPCDTTTAVTGCYNSNIVGGHDGSNSAVDGDDWAAVDGTLCRTEREAEAKLRGGDAAGALASIEAGLAAALYPAAATVHGLAGGRRVAEVLRRAAGALASELSCAREYARGRDEELYALSVAKQQAVDASNALRGASVEEIEGLRRELHDATHVQNERAAAQAAAQAAAERSQQELGQVREQAQQERVAWAAERASLRAELGIATEQVESARREGAKDVAAVRAELTRAGFELEQARESTRRDQREWQGEKAVLHAAAEGAAAEKAELQRELRELRKRTFSADGSIEVVTRRHTELLDALRSELHEAHAATHAATEAGLTDRHALEAVQGELARERAEHERALGSAQAVVRQWTSKCKQLKVAAQNAEARVAQASEATAGLEAEAASLTAQLVRSKEAAARDIVATRAAQEAAAVAATEAAADAAAQAAAELVRVRKEEADRVSQLQGELAQARRAAAKERLTRTGLRAEAERVARAAEEDARVAQHAQARAERACTAAEAHLVEHVAEHAAMLAAREEAAEQRSDAKCAELQAQHEVVVAAIKTEAEEARQYSYNGVAGELAASQAALRALEARLAHTQQEADAGHAAALQQQALHEEENQAATDRLAAAKEATSALETQLRQALEQVECREVDCAQEAELAEQALEECERRLQQQLQQQQEHATVELEELRQQHATARAQAQEDAAAVAAAEWVVEKAAMQARLQACDAKVVLARRETAAAEAARDAADARRREAIQLRREAEEQLVVTVATREQAVTHVALECSKPRTADCNKGVAEQQDGEETDEEQEQQEEAGRKMRAAFQRSMVAHSSARMQAINALMQEANGVLRLTANAGITGDAEVVAPPGRSRQRRPGRPCISSQGEGARSKARRHREHHRLQTQQGTGRRA